MSNKSIVIVDDEPMITENIKDILEISTSLSVTAFTRPADALSHIQKHPVDLLLTDYLMPGMNGLELLTRVREFYPAMPVLILTGYYNSREMDHLSANDDKIVIMLKPWSSSALLDRIQTLLGATPA